MMKVVNLMSDKLTDEARKNVSGLLHNLKAKSLRVRGGELTPEMQSIIDEIAELCSLTILETSNILLDIKSPGEFWKRYDECRNMLGWIGYHSHTTGATMKDEFGYDADRNVAFRQLCADVAKLKERQGKLSELLLSLATEVYRSRDTYISILDFVDEIARENEEDEADAK